MITQIKMKALLSAFACLLVQGRQLITGETFRRLGVAQTTTTDAALIVVDSGWHVAI